MGDELARSSGRAFQRAIEVGSDGRKQLTPEFEKARKAK
jgi:hypothetical protein